MWPLKAPELSAADVLEACTSNIRDTDLKKAFTSTATLLETSEARFIDAATTNTLHQLPATTHVGAISGKEMIWLYDKKLAKAKSPGRSIYDQIKMSAQFGRCPLCGRGTVSTLDHHLPKAIFADLCITPANLVPACQECNKNKSQSVPKSASEETLHPYYDDIESEIWLSARVIETSPAAFLFSIVPPASWSLTLTTRVQNHFRVYKLKSLFSSLAAEEFANIQTYLGEIAKASGPDGIREHLLSMGATYRTVRRNTWQAATYAAMAENHWFCSGGYASVG